MGNHPLKTVTVPPGSHTAVARYERGDLGRQAENAAGVTRVSRWLNYCSREHRHGVGLESMYLGNF